MGYIRLVKVYHFLPFLNPSDSLPLSKHQPHFETHSSQLSYIIIMAYPGFSQFTLVNRSTSGQIFPLLSDRSGGQLWDGSKDSNNAVDPGKSRPLRTHRLYLTSGTGKSHTFDLIKISDAPSSGSVVMLGGIKANSKDAVSDTTTLLTYSVYTSTAVTGRYYPDGEFNVDPPKSLFRDAAAIETYVKLSRPALAKVLVAIAGVISPGDI